MPGGRNLLILSRFKERFTWFTFDLEIAQSKLPSLHHPGNCEGQGSLSCRSPWGRRESDTTERLNWTEMNWYDMKLIILQIAFFTKQSVLACFLYWCLENYFIHFSCCMIFHVMNKPFIYLGLFSLCCINWLLGYFHFSSLMKNMLIDASLCTCVGVFLEQIQRNGITGA